VHRELPAAASARGDASDLIAILRDRVPRVALALAAGEAAQPAVKWLREQARERTTYTVKVAGTDDIYDDLHDWVLDQLAPSEQHALVAWSSKQGRLLEPAMFGGRGRPARPEPPALRLRYDGAREQVLRVGSHKIKVVVSENNGGDAERVRPPELIFTAGSLAGQRAILAEIGAVLRSSHDRKRRPATRVLDKWGDWEKLDDLPPRDPGSVILPAGQMERLVDDIARFLAAEQDYARRGMPWHRGHLYVGPPGTGKTSVARALATHFGMDIWVLPLADVQKDADLLREVCRVSPRSMLLLEDIDVFDAATKRTEEAGVTLSGLLNTLDGIATPHGLVSVLTTNSPDMIDPAVIRPGRVDLTEHFSLADADQVGRLVSLWYGVPALAAPEISWVAPAQVVEACKRHDDAAGALGELAALARARPGISVLRGVE
jgi:ATPase family associated with various cellular activities (AAA)